MKRKTRKEIEKLEEHIWINQRLWLLENPRKYKFNDKVEFRIIDHYEKIEKTTSGMFSHSFIDHNPVYKNEIGIVKGVESECKMVMQRLYEFEETRIFGESPIIECKSLNHWRTYYVEFIDRLIIVEEQDILKIV